MKISQMTTDQVLDLFCKITPCVENILSDEELVGLVSKAAKTEDITKAGIIALGLKKIVALTPLLLKNHREDVYSIIAAVNEQEVEEVASQNVLKTAKQIVEIFKDKELVDFFESLAQPEVSEPSEP